MATLSSQPDGPARQSLTARGPVASGRTRPAADLPLYLADLRQDAGEVLPVELRAVPYSVLGNRGEGPMRVWVPVTSAAPPPTGVVSA